jgi:transposase
LVDQARRHGIKAAARAFQTTVPTVRKWLRRYLTEGLKGLQERSRAPRSCPHKVRGAQEQQVLALRRQLPTFSARRLRGEFDLPVSPSTAYRIWHAHGLVARRRRKYQRKQDLAALKATWRLGQQISADTKDLDDIPHYWPQMQARGLPPIQYTAREVRSGLQFLAFAQHRSPGASALFAYRIQSHLRACGLDLPNLVWQIPQRGTVSSSASCSPTARAPVSPAPSASSVPNTSASRPPPTPTRATSKPSTA